MHVQQHPQTAAIASAEAVSPGWTSFNAKTDEEQVTHYDTPTQAKLTIPWYRLHTCFPDGIVEMVAASITECTTITELTIAHGTNTTTSATTGIAT